MIRLCWTDLLLILHWLLSLVSPLSTRIHSTCQSSHSFHLSAESSISPAVSIISRATCLVFVFIIMKIEMDDCIKNSTGSNNFDNATFDWCAQELELNGYSMLPLSALQSHRRKDVPTLIARAFATARLALDNNASRMLIDPNSDSARWTGFHNAASINGRYNQHREGFVFSNGEMFDVEVSVNHPHANFRNDMNQLFRIMHDNVATGVLQAIERRLKIPHCHFQHELGPTNNSSQWHMKRYVVDDQCNLSSNSIEDQQSGEEILLPAHTDPSLISVVVLDRVGLNVGGLGLEVFHPYTPRTIVGGGEWREIPHHGHDVAVIFVGSVLSYLTKGKAFPAAKHRVVRWRSSCTETIGNQVQNFIESRMAATLFVRPNGDAIMKPLASSDALRKNHPSFRVWNARVAKNYMKSRRKSSKLN